MAIASTGIAVGSNRGVDLGAEPNLLPPGAELRGEQCRFVQKSFAFVASCPESVERVGLLAELRGLGAVAVNPGEVSTESSCCGCHGHSAFSIAVNFSDEQARSDAARQADKTESDQSARVVSIVFWG